jgi:hypothetical protein
MKLILVASPKKLEALLEEALDSFSYTAKKLADNFANASQSLAQTIQKQYQSLTNKSSEEIAACLLSTKTPPMELQQKLAIIAEHLELPVPILYVPLDQTEHLQFDIGDSPSDGCFYISHPLLESVFIRPSAFNSVLAKEKEIAFTRLAGALGAKTIHIHNVEVTQKGQLFGGKIKPHILAPQLGIQANFDKKGELIREVYKQYHKPKRAPYIPQQLAEWVKLDPALRQMAEDRIDLNLASSRIKLQFRETNTTGTQIALTLAGRNLEIGGQVQKIYESTWTFLIEFFDKDELNQ